MIWRKQPKFTWRDVIDTTMRYQAYGGTNYKAGTLDDISAGVEMMIEDTRKNKKKANPDKIIDLIEQMLTVRELKKAA